MGCERRHCRVRELELVRASFCAKATHNGTRVVDTSSVPRAMAVMIDEGMKSISHRVTENGGLDAGVVMVAGMLYSRVSSSSLKERRELKAKSNDCNRNPISTIRRSSSFTMKSPTKAILSAWKWRWAGQSPWRATARGTSGRTIGTCTSVRVYFFIHAHVQRRCGTPWPIGKVIASRSLDLFL